MTYKPTTAQFEGRTKTYYIIWDESQKYRGGVRHNRTHVKKFYVSGNLMKINRTIGRYRNKLGGVTTGIKVIFRNPVKGFTATRKRTHTKYKSPRKIVRVTKIVPIPGASVGKRVKITSIRPKGALNIK